MGDVDMTKDFEKELAQLAKIIEQTKEHVVSEEAAKVSFVMPFFKALGYNVYNPLEFVPEFTADIHGKNVDRVDYVIMENGQPMILIVCKRSSEPLHTHAKQLFKYFVSTPAKFAILTNGIEYLFYTDLEESNKLDKKAFLSVNMLDMKSHALKELYKFRKDTFNVNEILTTAEELKYTASIISFLSDEYQQPSDDFVKYVLTKVYDGVRTQPVIDKFRPTIKNSFTQFVNELINDKLETAFKRESAPTEPETVAVMELDAVEDDDFAVSEEALEAFYITKAILTEVIEASRVSYKATTAYVSIIVDNKVSKWVCRFTLSKRSKSFHTPTEPKINIESVNDIYKHKEVLLQSVKRFL